MATTLPREPVTSSPFEEIVHLERTYLVQNYARYPLALHRGKGCYVYDLDGKPYLDLITGIGVNALGHAHPRIVKLIREQAALMIHSSNLYYNEYQGRLAERMAKISGLSRCVFANSGTEAMETALKMVRAHGNSVDQSKYEVVSVEGSFHGRTLGSLSITGQPAYRRDFEPLLPGVRFVARDDLQALEDAVSAKTAGIVLEVIQGEGGIRPLTETFIRRARELADQQNALLVLDEIQCGVGRPGAHFAYQLFHPQITPDIVLAAKPIACGIPLAVTIANEKAAATIKPGMHGSTYAGGPLACRVALEFFDILDELLPSIRSVGAYFRAKLEGLARSFSFIKEVRGQGLMLGVELNISGKQLVLDGIQEGLLFNCTHETVLRFLPPYIITEKEVDKAIRILKRLFQKAEKQSREQ
jgi:acetylornithine/N-succinyldiaminopimelate aminotransferase